MSNGCNWNWAVLTCDASPLSKIHMQKPCKTINRYHICFYDNGLRLTVLKRRNMGLTLHSLTGSNITACFSSQLLTGRGIVTVERALWPVMSLPAIWVETRCPVSSCLYNGLRGNDLRVIETRHMHCRMELASVCWPAACRLHAPSSGLLMIGQL